MKKILSASCLAVAISLLFALNTCAVAADVSSGSTIKTTSERQYAERKNNSVGTTFDPRESNNKNQMDSQVNSNFEKVVPVPENLREGRYTRASRRK